MLRIAIEPDRWDGSWLRGAFWLWNVGLALMVFVSVLPVGFLQLEAVFTARMIIAGTALYAADLARKRFVLRATEDDPDVEDMAVAEGGAGRRLGGV